jgi:pimeloyl-ACP methyl ester carboxylesterase
VFLQWQLRVVRMKVGPSAERIKHKRWYRFEQVRNLSSTFCCAPFRHLRRGLCLVRAISRKYSRSPLQLNTRPKGSGRYQLAFIEFGDQGSNLDNSQIKAALDVIHQAERPILFVYIHGWQNNANSRDVCRFEHFLDKISSFSQAAGRKLNVIGVYIAWRGRDLVFPGLNLLTFFSRKAVAAGIASQVSCLATLDELALAARDPSKKVHRCILIGHSFGGLLLGNTLSHSILDASGFGTRNTSPWDMAVMFNSADSSISTRQLMKELDYLYQYDPIRHAYVSRSAADKEATAIPEADHFWSSFNRRTICQLRHSSPLVPNSITR